MNPCAVPKAKTIWLGALKSIAHQRDKTEFRELLRPSKEQERMAYKELFSSWKAFRNYRQKFRVRCFVYAVPVCDQRTRCLQTFISICFHSSVSSIQRQPDETLKGMDTNLQILSETHTHTHTHTHTQHYHHHHHHHHHHQACFSSSLFESGGEKKKWVGEFHYFY